jgi:ATP-binding cassette subfamily B protein
MDSKPQEPTQKWWHRLADAIKKMHSTPRMVSIIWRASPRLCLIVMALNAVAALLPAAEIEMTKSLLDVITQHSSIAVETQIVAAVLGFIALVSIFSLLRECVQPTVRLFQDNLGELVTRDVKALLFHKTNSLVDISIFENPTFYDKLEKVQGQSQYEPAGLLHSLNYIVQGTIGLVSMLIILLMFQPLLALGIVCLALPPIIAQFKQQYEYWELSKSEVPLQRKMRYYGDLITGSQTAKELRLFGLGGFFLKLYLSTSEKFSHGHMQTRRRHWRANIFLATVASTGNMICYAYVAWDAIRRIITPGQFTLYLGAINQVSAKMDDLIWGITRLYSGNLFFNEFFEFLELPLPWRYHQRSSLNLCPDL